MDDTYRLKVQLAVLKEVAKDYSHQTIDSIIRNLEAIIKNREKNAN